MPIRSPRWFFAAALVLAAPETPGVFELWDNDEVVYLGATRGSGESLRHALAREMELHEATHFSWEITWQPAMRERELLEEYLTDHARPPRFNQG